MEINDQTLTELVRLTRENNRMLHGIRRRAFWGGLVKFILYALVLVAAPLWLYATYIGPMMEQMLDTYQQFQGTGAQAQAQLQDFQKLLQQFKNPFKAE